MTIDKVDESYTGCDKCIHSDDSEEICRARLCIHAINHLKECYKPRKSKSLTAQDDCEQLEIWSGMNVQIIAPAGTFKKIHEDEEDDVDI